MVNGCYKANEVYHLSIDNPEYFEDFICELMKYINHDGLKTNYYRFFYIDKANFAKLYKKYDLWEVSYRFKNKEQHFADPVRKIMMEKYQKGVEELKKYATEKGFNYYEDN